MRYLSPGTSTRISRIGLGTWQFGSREWGYAGQEAHAIVRRAVELGVTLFDTAEIYGLGRSERILGAALGDDRDSVFLATKLFPLLPVAPVVEQRAVASANRLGARRLDLYQVHQPNPVIRDGTIMRGMRALQRVGLVGEVGASRAPYKAAHSVPAHMQRHGWRIIPVNPHADQLLGEPAYRTLADVPEQVGLVDVFRPSGQTPDIARQAVAAGATALWLQLGIASAEARAIAEDAGLLYVEDRCLVIEQRRLNLEAPGR